VLVRNVVRKALFLFKTHQAAFFNLFFESLLRKCMVMLRLKFQIASSLGFIQTINGEIKKSAAAIKISTNPLKALLSIARKLYKLLLNFILSTQFWTNSKANDYFKPVHTKKFFLVTSTYTFNFIFYKYFNIKEEIWKKTLLNESTYFNNKLAPKFCSFSISISKSKYLVPVIKCNINEHFNKTSFSNFDSTCQVSLNTILFLEKMNKIENVRCSLFKTAFSINSLLAAYDQIKFKSRNLTSNLNKQTLKEINLKWFQITSNKLFKNIFIYPKIRRIYINKNTNSLNNRPIIITSPSVKIIERSILNALQPIFEGKLIWKSINKLEYDFLKKKNKEISIAKNKSGYYKKIWTIPPIFSRFSFGFRSCLSVHRSLQLVKSWPTNLNWFLKFDIVKTFDSINRNRLKNIFLNYCADHRIWNEINKIINAKIISFMSISSCNDLGISQNSVLSPFLFNIYMTILDKFVESLQLKYNNSTFFSATPFIIQNDYKQLMKKFKTKRGLANIIFQTGSPKLVLALFKKEKSAFYKKYSSSFGETTSLRQIKYIRYADDFLISISGSRKFALNIASLIKNFIKSNLHFVIHEVTLTNTKAEPVQFLGFNIYLSVTKNQAKIKYNKIKSTHKYKMRTIARLNGSNNRLSQAYFNSIKHGFLNYLQNVYEKFNLKKNIKTDALLIKNFINKNSEEFISSIFFQHSSQPSFLKLNQSLRRFTQHFKDLYSKNINTSLRVWENSFKYLELFKKNFVLTKELSKILIARDNFLAELKLIEKSMENSKEKTDKQTTLNAYRQKKTSKFFKISPLFQVTEKQFAQTAKLISRSWTLNPTRFFKISIRVDIKKLYLKFTNFGFYSLKRNLPTSVTRLLYLNDYEIISFYNSLIRGYLKWFRCADNFIRAKNIIWTLRISCLKTLARKHKKNLKWALSVFTIHVTAKSPKGALFKLPSLHEISQMNSKFLIKDDFQQPDEINFLNKYSLRFYSSSSLFSQCAVFTCQNIDIEIHHIKKLAKRINSNSKLTILTTKNKKLSGLIAILSAVNCKNIPLCASHHLDFEQNKFSQLDINFLKKIYKIDCSSLNFEDIFMGK
jgi:hypothetical protein